MKKKPQHYSLALNSLDNVLTQYHLISEQDKTGGLKTTQSTALQCTARVNTRKFSRIAQRLTRLCGAPLSELPGTAVTSKLSDMAKQEKGMSVWEALFFT